VWSLSTVRLFSSPGKDNALSDIRKKHGRPVQEIGVFELLGEKHAKDLLLGTLEQQLKMQMDMLRKGISTGVLARSQQLGAERSAREGAVPVHSDMCTLTQAAGQAMTNIAAESAVHLNIRSTPKKENAALQNETRFFDAPTLKNGFNEDAFMDGGCDFTQEDVTRAQFDDDASMDVEHESANATHTCNNAMIGVEEGTEFPSPPDLIPARGA